MSIYKTVIRPAAEYCSVAYHSLIPKYLVEALERAQKQAMKVIYGVELDYGMLLENGVLEGMEERREKNCLKFAFKARARTRIFDFIEN